MITALDHEINAARAFIKHEQEFLRRNLLSMAHELEQGYKVYESELKQAEVSRKTIARRQKKLDDLLKEQAALKHP